MPYGHLSGRIDAVLHRLGKECTVLERTETGTDGFNNPTESYDDNGATVRCVRSYPSRNAEAGGIAGDRQTDSPLFFFQKGETPTSNSRIKYPEDAETPAAANEFTTYELQAPTRYDSHVEMYGEIVINP